jgi:hypothetical protein
MRMGQTLSLQKDDPDVQYTLAAIEDELVYTLYSVITLFLNHNNIFPIRQKYIEQAENILYHINLFQPVPVFVINISDIPGSLRKELERITSSEKRKVITGAVARILEDLDPRYFRISGVRRNIEWRIEP